MFSIFGELYSCVVLFSGNNPKPAVGRWGRWAVEQKLLFSIFGVLYFCVVLFSGFYFILFLILSDFLVFITRYDLTSPVHCIGCSCDKPLHDLLLF